MSAPGFHRDFLVTCLGAYDDSGLGTGGFVAVQDGAALILDRIDSTGLCAHGDTVYRFARGLRSIAGYRADGFRSLLKVSEARDIHDVVVRDGLFVCASTGTNEILWIDPFGKIVRRWRAEGERDAWHLNCFCEFEGRLHVSAFGRFSGHRGWVGQCTGQGFILDFENGREVVSGLNGPHNPRFVDGKWIVCDSHASTLLVQGPGEAARRVALGGFTRGFDWDERFFYVGESANRKEPIPPDHSSIAVVDRAMLEVVARITVPFPEIYELLRISPEFAMGIAAEPSNFQIDQSAERFAALENQVALGWREIDELKRRIAAVRGFEQLRSRVINIKRKLVG
jgi:hypothetical protein